MNAGDEFSMNCPLPLSDYPEIVMAHGGGGAMTQRLFDEIFEPAFRNPMLDSRHDGAILEHSGSKLAFTTDSYVVRPHEFPGGDIGKLAVSGTVNDLLMCGARPAYLSLGLIIEEGFPVPDLLRIVKSIQETADEAGVHIVTGDTKVVERGSGDGIFINTSGIGVLDGPNAPSPERIRPGDVIIVSGDIGRHGVAIMAARESLELKSTIESDTASLCRPVQALLNCGADVHCLRDPTRGGLTTALVELAQTSGTEFLIDETGIPISESVRAVCEILGLDPLYVANEGRFIAFVPECDAEKALSVLTGDPLCPGPRVIGAVHAAERGSVACKTAIGGVRAIDMFSGEQLPRIC